MKTYIILLCFILVYLLPPPLRGIIFQNFLYLHTSKNLVNVPTTNFKRANDLGLRLSARWKFQVRFTQTFICIQISGCKVKSSAVFIFSIFFFPTENSKVRTPFLNAKNSKWENWGWIETIKLSYKPYEKISCPLQFACAWSAETLLPIFFNFFMKNFKFQYLAEQAERKLADLVVH